MKYYFNYFPTKLVTVGHYTKIVYLMLNIQLLNNRYRKLLLKALVCGCYYIATSAFLILISYIHVHSIHTIHNNFLGLEISYTPDGIVLTQKKFTPELLRDSSLTTFHKAVTPFPLILNYTIMILLYLLIQLITCV